MTDLENFKDQIRRLNQLLNDPKFDSLNTVFKVRVLNLRHFLNNLTWVKMSICKGPINNPEVLETIEVLIDKTEVFIDKTDAIMENN